MAKPSVLPEWASTLANDPTTGQPNRVEPAGSKKVTGWNYNEKPPRQYFNWFQWLVYKWVEWFDSLLDQGVKTTDSPTFANATITTQLNADNVEANNVSAKVGDFRNGTTGTVHSNLVKSTVSVETPFVKTDEVITSVISVDVSGADLTLQTNSSHSVVLNSSVKIGGSSAPAIKQKLITGTTGAKNGYSLTPHGLDWSKTISFSVIVYTADNKYALPCDILSSGVHWYDALLTDTNIQIWVGADADNAASRPFKCLITYSE